MEAILDLTVEFDIGHYRKIHKDFDQWFFSMLNDLNIKFYLAKGKPVIKGCQLQIISFYSKLNEIENKTLEDLLSEPAKRKV